MPKSFFSRVPKITTHDQMMATLQARTGKITSLEWARVPGTNAMRSVDGGYSIAAERHQGEWRFIVFKRLPTPTVIGTFKSSEEAQQCATTSALSGS